MFFTGLYFLSNIGCSTLQRNADNFKGYAYPPFTELEKGSLISQEISYDDEYKKYIFERCLDQNKDGGIDVVTERDIDLKNKKIDKYPFLYVVSAGKFDSYYLRLIIQDERKDGINGNETIGYERKPFVEIG